MDVIVQTLAQFALREIFEEKSKSQSDLKAWLANQSYYTQQVVSKNAFLLDFQRNDLLFVSMANDCNRLSQAAFETISSLQPHPLFPRSHAWTIIQTYYAAFFSAHALLRIYGRSCSQLESEHLSKVLEVAKMLGHDNGLRNIENGFYIATVNSLSSEIEFLKLRESHADTWACFLSMLSDLENLVSNAVTTSSNKILVIDFITALKRGLQRSGCLNKGNWLSKFRNSINYRHSNGVWFPYPKHHRISKLTSTEIREWKIMPTNFSMPVSVDDVSVFYGISNAIVGLSYNLLLYLFNTSNSPSSSFRNGVIRMINYIESES